MATFVKFIESDLEATRPVYINPEHVQAVRAWKANYYTTGSMIVTIDCTYYVVEELASVVRKLNIYDEI
jgi:hypothetical protein